MSKTFKIILIIFLSLITIALTVVLVIGLIKKPKLFSNEPYELVINENYENEFEIINIKSTAGEIIVKNSNEDNIRVKIYGNESTSSVNKENNILNISELGNKCKYFCINNKLSKIEVEIPKDYDKKINITNNFGDIEVSKFDKAILSITENAGDVKIDSGYDIEVVNNLGEIEISNVFNYLKVKENAGNVKINNLSIKKDSFISNDLGNIEVNSINEVFVDAKADIGKVDVNNKYRDSEITLKIENRLGNITVR